MRSLAGLVILAQSLMQYVTGQCNCNVGSCTTTLTGDDACGSGIYRGNYETCLHNSWGVPTGWTYECCDECHPSPSINSYNSYCDCCVANDCETAYMQCSSGYNATGLTECCVSASTCPSTVSPIAYNEYCGCCVENGDCESAYMSCSRGYVATGLTECCRPATCLSEDSTYVTDTTTVKAVVTSG